MSSLSKIVKKYERHLLLALVILLLATFSITGAITCAGGGRRGVDVGGSFLVTPTERASLSSDEVRAVRMRYADRGRRAVEGPTIRYRPFLQGANWPSPWVATWAHILLVEAAKRAGLRVGEGQRDHAVRQVVSNATRLEFSDAAFERFLRNEYRGSAADLRETVGEIVLTDTFIEPFMEAARYEVSYEDAYETWKPERERVNLRYVALSGDPFAEIVRTEEATRTEIARQEDVLAKVAAAARQVRLLLGSAAAHERQKGKAPASLEEIQASVGTSGATKDPWGNPIRYALRDGKPWPSSDGVDGKPDTADDVGPDAVKALETHAILREVANALRQWREAAKAWPDSIARLRERPAENTLPPLKRTEVKDGYGRDLVFEAAPEGGSPRLSSAGADGTPGTADDVVAEVTADLIRVPAGPGLTPFLLPDLKDAWGRGLRVQVKSPEGWVFEVQSAGADGAFATADDVVEGNGAERLDFYGRPGVKTEFVDPIRRRFRAIVLHLPLMPDDVLGKLWNDEAWKSARPADEEKLFEQWRFYKDYPFYGAADPRDPATGYGVALAQRLAPDAKVWSVPDRAIFGEPPAGFAKEDDPLRKEYLEKGWREVVLREYFVENILNSLLTKARESRDALKAWDERKAKGEDVGERPAEVTLPSLFEATFGPHVAGAGAAAFAKTYETPELMSQDSWEAIPDLGDINFSTNMSRAVGDGELAPIVIPVHGRLTRVLAQNLEFKGQRQRTFEEVSGDAKFVSQYLAARQLGRARRELEALRRLVETKEQAAEGEAKAKAFDEALAEWSASAKVPYALEETGLFIGSSPPPPATVPEGASDEDAQRIRRRNFVWQAGYATVRPTPSKQDTVDATPGTFGRTVLEDTTTGADATKSAYLIRVLDRRYPGKEEMSPERWVRIAIQKYFGDLLGGSGMAHVLHMREGAAFQVLGRFFDDLDWFQARFDLKTRSDLSQSGASPLE